MGWLKKIWAWITGFGADKYMHYIAGGLITGVLAIVPCAAFWAFGFGFLGGLLKEVVDWLRGGAFDWKDMVATFAGALSVQGCVWLYLLIW